VPASGSQGSTVCLLMPVFVRRGSRWNPPSSPHYLPDYGITDWAIEKLKPVPATSCSVPFSVIEKRVTVAGRSR